jgi:hypothetical protein
MEAKTGSDEYKARRMRHNFEKSKYQSQSLRLWENLAESDRIHLDKQVPLEPMEIPVLAYVRDDGTWMVTTTRRVLWSSLSLRGQLRCSQIKTLGWSQGPRFGEERKDPEEIDMWIQTPEGKQLAKLAASWIFICDTTGKRHEVLIEPLVATDVFNCLLFTRSLARAHPESRSQQQ